MSDLSDPLRKKDGVRVRDTIATAFVSWDFAAGIGAGGFAALLAVIPEVRGSAPTIIVAELAVNVALLTAVLAALAVFVTFFDGHYRRVLEAAGGIRRAMQPYLIVAAVAGFGAVVALLVALGWPGFGPWPRAVLLGVSTGLCGWTIAGVVSLVEITIFHGTQRAELMRGVEDVAQLRARRLTERQPR